MEIKKFKKYNESFEIGIDISQDPINDISKIITDISIISNDIETREKKYKALWDTGATSTLISENVVNDLKLEQIGTSELTSIHKKDKSFLYNSGIIIPNHRKAILLHVSSFRKDDEYDVIIGMDIIREGNLKLDNGKLSFIIKKLK
jgi:predicted aspartyl protease